MKRVTDQPPSGQKGAAFQNEAAEFVAKFGDRQRKTECRELGLYQLFLRNAF